MIVLLRDFLNAPATIYTPSNQFDIFAEDLNSIKATIGGGYTDPLTLITARFSADTLSLLVNGVERINDLGEAKFRNTTPEADITYDLGIAGFRWRQVHAGTYFGSGRNLSGIALNPLTTNLDFFSTFKGINHIAPTLATDVATKGYVDSLIASSATITTVGAGTSTIATVALANNSVYHIEAVFVARRTDAADRGSYARRAVIFREAAGAATIVGTVDTNLTRESLPGLDGTIAVSGNNVIFTVDGAAGATVNWKVFYSVSKVVS